ncbi:MAG: carbamoyl-phosphate synthase large subunit [Betaproteobacteria bacterium]|nr:MAG: carbamoyl-phosphate synthase large subunit [Betaproteobacteria bacterium]
MKLEHLLIANRGEIAIRIARSAAEANLRSHAIYSEDDAQSDHVTKADVAHRLRGTGPAAYLDAAQIIDVAREANCDAIHPGYGFLSENAEFARSCESAGLLFVGPTPEVLEAFGDKGRARALAEQCEVPVLPGTDGPTTLAQARKFLTSLGRGGAIMIKAIAGGGGRGMRQVLEASELESAFERCSSEAKQAFGNGDVYIETLFPKARHIEVQVLGDGSGDVAHLWERECSLQRNRQKLVEIAPAPGLSSKLRERLIDAALRMARAVKLRNLATFEFLVEQEAGDQSEFAFIEANARLQVEHTVTEEVTAVDLVRTQFDIAAGRTLKDMGLFDGEIPSMHGIAMQVRINAETMSANGMVRPAAGTLDAFDPPAGPGVRVDTCGHGGFRVNPRFDSLLAKVIVHVAPGHVNTEGQLRTVAAKARRALSEFRISGVSSNREFLLNLISSADFLSGHWYTGLIENNLATLCTPTDHPRLYGELIDASAPAAASAVIDSVDPLAVLSHGKRDIGAAAQMEEAPLAEGLRAIAATISGTIVSIDVSVGDTIRRGQQVAVMEAMKMEHVIVSPVAGVVEDVRGIQNQTLLEGAALLTVNVAEDQSDLVESLQALDLDSIRPDLAELQQRRALTLDAARPDAVEKRRKLGFRTARENVADLCDPDSFYEYGAFTIAAQRSRRTMEDLIKRTPADGLVMGVGRVNGALFPDVDARCMVMAYDYTVLAGTQGHKNHEKKDRFFELAAEWRLPVIAFAEGGGGRPGDTDILTSGWLNIKAFTLLAKLSGLVPLVGVVSGRCFAGNAVVAGCCDVIIATERTSLGMGGPAMIEGGGLGVYHPDEVGPTSVQRRNGVIDVVVADEAEAVQVAKKYISYFQGPVKEWSCADQRELRHVVPENRLRVYDVRRAIHLIADTGSVLELRRDFGTAMITAFIRIEGRPMGLIANNAMVLGGAIDSDAADKAARFLQLCDAYDLPVLSLCDTPGNMVGPDAEREALVRHCCRLYVIGANMTVPIFSVVLRKAYGLGSQGMVGGSFHLPMFSVAWPTGEFGPMNLEGSVKLGFRKELEAIEDPQKRKEKFENMVAEAYERGKALSTATLFEIDDVIDPADTRAWVTAGLRSLPPRQTRADKKRACVDTW